MTADSLSLRARLAVAAGGALVAAGLAADWLGFGGGPGVGLRQLAMVLLGASLMAVQVWRGAAQATPAATLLVWTALGLACGLLDAVAVAVRRHGLGELIHTSPDYPWVMPLAYLALFAALALPLALAARIAPRVLTLPVAVFLPGVFAAWGLSRHLGWLDEIAATVLALGVGTLLARAARAAPTRSLRLAKIGVVALLGYTAVAAVVVLWSAAQRERAALAALPAAAQGAPNVLLIVLDTVRADHMGLHGYQRQTTPCIDRLATEGVAFDDAITTAPWTLTSHVSMFTGRYPHETTADWKSALDGTHPTLAEALSAHGYATAGFVGNLFYCGAENGIARGFSRYEDYDLKPGVLACTPTLGREIVARVSATDPAFTVTRNGADEVTDGLLEWLADREQPERPFFAFLNYFDAHAVYAPPPDYDLFGPRSPRLYDMHKRGWMWSAWSPEEQQGFVDAYDGCIRFIDDQIERLLAELDARGVLDDTLVIVTADHGELFGENNMHEHANSLFRPLLHAPLVFRQPGIVPAGRRVSAPVSLVDLPATVCELVGIEPATPFPGHSLAGYLGTAEVRELVRSPLLAEISQSIRMPPALPASKGDMKSLLLDGLHYIQNGDGSESLYDWHADPREENDLAATRPADLARLREALATTMAR